MRSFRHCEEKNETEFLWRDDINIESDDKKNMPIIAKLMNVVIS